MEQEFLNYLQLGGNTGIVALIYLLWKIDRRLLALEIKFGIVPIGDIKNAVTDHHK